MNYEETILWSDNIIQATLRYREMTLEEFINEGGNFIVYDLIRNSKVGYIKVTKISDNIGYLSSGESEEGITAGFGEGLNLYIVNTFNWFKTSVIQKIDWDKKEFTTMNSRYKFEFEEIDYYPILKKLNHESTSN